MPEMVEVERYRRSAEQVVGRRITCVDVIDAHVARGGPGVAGLVAALTGRTVTAARRRGKLLLLDTGDGPTLGMRFGMTGYLVVDGRPALERLLRVPELPASRWARLRICLAGESDAGRELVLHDPRRLGRVELDPSEDALGPDALGVTVAQLARALATGRSSRRRAGRSGRRGGLPPGSAGPGRPEAGAGGHPEGGNVGGPALKTRLMDQSRLAGVGNLIADETLWRAGLSPLRPAEGLSGAEVRRLHRHLRATVTDMLERGGSDTGDLMARRRPGGRCPKDGTPLLRAAVAGRTTWWCPRHQS